MNHQQQIDQVVSVRSLLEDLLDEKSWSYEYVTSMIASLEDLESASKIARLELCKIQETCR